MNTAPIFHLSVHWDGVISLWDTPLKRQHGAPDEVHVDLVLTADQDRILREAYQAKWPDADTKGWV